MSAKVIEAECSVLVSEDMQNGMLIDDRWRIVNPCLPLN
jgi:predicted nucleic acid-binding protein